ncbi:hypothetical protein FRX31_032378 [Thalictrum thalictroides]|uniref:Uncharacterized protein n=1 Tax=Thalictrum thalictroides TaxID=46969 RepID=A0A7J6V1D3_THATH|nr:hypothetical protein FRX31_032378 [Thalictrum thalictroides]
MSFVLGCQRSLLRSQLTEERRNLLRERDRLSYRHRRDNLDEAEAESFRSRRRGQLQLHTENLTDEELSNFWARQRQLYQNHIRQNPLNAQLEPPTFRSQAPGQPQPPSRPFLLDASSSGPSSSSESLDLQPMNIYDVNFSSNWSAYRPSTDVIQAEEEYSATAPAQAALPRPSRRGRHEDAYLNCARNFVTTTALPTLNLAHAR